MSGVWRVGDEVVTINGNRWCRFDDGWSPLTSFWDRGTVYSDDELFGIYFACTVDPAGDA